MLDQQDDIQWVFDKLKENPHYGPYCMRCETADRMKLVNGGFRCDHCKNKWKLDQKRIDAAIAGTTETKSDGASE